MTTAEKETKDLTSTSDLQTIQETEKSKERARITHSIGDKMDSWLDLLQDSRGIRQVYGDNLPSLGSAEIINVVLKRGGPTVLMDVNLRTFPDNPPAKWVKQNANTVQIALELYGTERIQISGWTTEYEVDLNLIKDHELITLSATGNGTDIVVVANVVDIVKISAYHSVTHE